MEEMGTGNLKNSFGKNEFSAACLSCELCDFPPQWSELLLGKSGFFWVEMTRRQALAGSRLGWTGVMRVGAISFLPAALSGSRACHRYKYTYTNTDTNTDKYRYTYRQIQKKTNSDKKANTKNALNESRAWHQYKYTYTYLDTNTDKYR